MRNAAPCQDVKPRSSNPDASLFHRDGIARISGRLHVARYGRWLWLLRLSTRRAAFETISRCLFNNKIFYLLNQNTYSVMENDTLVAIPLFLFMGYVVERAKIVNNLYYALQMAARNLPGSMAIAALITCAVFSTASGIVGAVVTLMGLLAFPAMAKSPL